MNKTELRQKYKNLRQQLSENEIEEMSLQIANQLLSLNIWQHYFYHVFLPIVNQKEVNTDYIIQILNGKDKNIVISKSNFETTEMEHFLLTDNLKIKVNNYEIPEPIETDLTAIEINSKKIEVVFVPLLAFDVLGNRIGYGKGFYDKFLANCKPETLKIGVSFFEPEPAFENVFSTDIQLDFCVTANQIFKF